MAVQSLILFSSLIVLGSASELWINLWNESTRYESSFPGWKDNFNDSAVFYCRGSPESYFGYWLRYDHDTGEGERFCELFDYADNTSYERFLFRYYGEADIRIDVQLDAQLQELHSRTLVNREIYPRDEFRCVHGSYNTTFYVAESQIRLLPGRKNGYEMTCQTTELLPVGEVTTQWLIGSLPRARDRPIVLQDPDHFTVRWNVSGGLWEDEEHQAGNLSRILAFNETQLTFVRRPPFCVDCFHQSGNRVVASRECVDRPGPRGVRGRGHRPAGRIRDPVRELVSVPPTTEPEPSPDPDLQLKFLFLVLWFPFLVVMSIFALVINCVSEERARLRRATRRVRDRLRSYLLKVREVGEKRTFRPVLKDLREDRTPLLDAPEKA